MQVNDRKWNEEGSPIPFSNNDVLSVRHPKRGRSMRCF